MYGEAMQSAPPDAQKRLLYNPPQPPPDGSTGYRADSMQAA